MPTKRAAEAAKKRKAYIDSKAVPLMNLNGYCDWLYALTRNNVDQFVSLTTDNRKNFFKAFGRAEFTWIDSDRRPNPCWVFKLENGLTVYVFTGTRGSSLEVGLPQAPDKIGLVREPWLSKQMIEFVQKLIPMCRRVSGIQEAFRKKGIV